MYKKGGDVCREEDWREADSKSKFDAVEGAADNYFWMSG